MWHNQKIREKIFSGKKEKLEYENYLSWIKNNDPDEKEKTKILNEIKSLKERYGIERHYLEKIIE